MNDNIFLFLSSENALYKNHASDFTVSIESLILPGDWEIALYDLSFILEPFTITYSKVGEVSHVISVISNGDTFVASTINDINNDIVMEQLESKHVVIKSQYSNFRISFPIESDAKALGFTSRIIDCSSNICFSTNTRSVLHNLTTNVDVIFKKDERKYKTITFKSDIVLRNQKDLLKYMNSMLTNVFLKVAIVDNIFYFRIKEDIFDVIFDVGLVHTLGLDRRRYVAKTSHLYSGETKVLINTVDMIYVYCNIIKPTIVGDIKAPLLKSVLINSILNTESVFHINLKKPLYLPLDCNYINNIKFNIRDSFGNFLNFNSNVKSAITLNLRKRK